MIPAEERRWRTPWVDPAALEQTYFDLKARRVRDPIRKTGEQFGLGRQATHSRLQALGAIERHHADVTARVERALDMVRAGASRHHAAVATGLGYDKVCDAAKRAGIPSDGQRYSKFEWTPDRDERLWWLYQAGATLREMAAALGLRSPHIVGDRLEALGLPIRPASHYLRTHPVDASAFGELDSPRRRCFFGLMLTDGCIFNNMVILGLTWEDYEVVSSFRDFLDTDYPIVREFKRHGPQDQQPMAILRVKSAQLAANLKRLGIKEGKSWDCEWPALPLEAQPDLALGAFDGDGNFDTQPSNPKIRFTGTRSAMEGLDLVLRAACDLGPRELIAKPGTAAVTLSVGGRHQVYRVAAWMTQRAQPMVARKREKIVHFINDYRQRHPERAAEWRHRLARFEPCDA